ncbi:hypothetical protein BDD14_3280 [Edaphobacter modestus]|uniref:Uncharacterized protein n=1 Tax=Edaphobacter modestus TaxID=388466 RepID=A0A4Q7YVC6_9BACT|nr:hypothetical protein BDD14_3280 [Edaphobacter modestus]
MNQQRFVAEMVVAGLSPTTRNVLVIAEYGYPQTANYHLFRAVVATLWSDSTSRTASCLNSSGVPILSKLVILQRGYVCGAKVNPSSM